MGLVFFLDIKGVEQYKAYFFSSMIVTVSGSIGEGSYDGEGVGNRSAGNGTEKDRLSYLDHFEYNVHIHARHGHLP